MLSSRFQSILSAALLMASCVLYFGCNQPIMPKFSVDQEDEDASDYQYVYAEKDIYIPSASAEEPTLASFSLDKARDYVDQGALAWTNTEGCVTCHTNGTYMVVRPALSKWLGKPSGDVRKFFVENLKSLKESYEGTGPVVYIAAGLAEWDAHITKKLSADTDNALRYMFELQLSSGTWQLDGCWPPFESSPYQLATVAARAAAIAPGWQDGLQDKKLINRVAQLHDYLKTTAPPNDYERMLLLWTSARVPGLLSDAQKQEIIAMVWTHQRDDGGWAMRTFAEPEQWGNGKRAGKLRSEPEFGNPPSDGHQTGLAVMVLRDAGVPHSDARIQKAVQWLLANQRQSGRWWTRSLNSDDYHYITFSGTCYPLLALARCNALTQDAVAQAN